MAMDPKILRLGRVQREIAKVVEQGASKEEKLQIIDFGEKKLAELRKEIEAQGDLFPGT